MGQAKKLLKESVKAAYSTVGDRVHLQSDGLPMGQNAAVNLSNLYMFMYELAFMEQLVDAYLLHQHNPAAASKQRRLDALRLLRQFLSTGRYIDDIFGADAPEIERLQNVSNTHLGFHGIYPNELQLECTARGHSVDFLDVTVKHAADSFHARTLSRHPAGYLVTELHDKRRGELYADVHFMRFPDINSLLTRSSKLGILNSQFHRYRRLITSYPNFVAEMALLLTFMVRARHYPEQQLIKRLNRCCHTTSGLFAQASNAAVFFAIKDTYERLSATVAATPGINLHKIPFSMAEQAFIAAFPPSSAHTLVMQAP
jgi:hypothetical protein